MNKAVLSTPADLLAAGLIESTDLAAVTDVARSFGVGITDLMRRQIGMGAAGDPIAAQFVPTAAEMNFAPEELTDPIGDTTHSPVPGIVHRYPDRVLLKPINVCAVYCRFCFRREHIGADTQALSVAALEAALAYIDSHEEVWEVILSGGDPFLLSPRRMTHIMDRLAAIRHVGVVRLHTRIPTVKPDLVNAALLAALKIDKAVYVVLHTNHANELSAAAREACARLIDAGIPMLSQSVLLRGVNADAATLRTLFRSLVAMRIKPYYLHHGDLARGTAHFRTTIAEGQAVMRALRGHVSGLCQPTYVLDIPGGHGKVPIGPGYLAEQGEGRYVVTDHQGRTHRYPASG